MDSRTAFHTIKAALASRADTEVIRAEYDEQLFGNFVIAFSTGQVPRSIVLDRGELVICKGLNASHECRTLLAEIRDVGEDRLLDVITSV